MSIFPKLRIGRLTMHVPFVSHMERYVVSPLHWGHHVFLVSWVINFISSTVWVCDHDLALSPFTWASLISHLAFFEKFHSSETWLHSAFLKCTFCSLNPQALTFPLGATHFTFRVPNLNPWAPELHNLCPSDSHNCALRSVKPQASNLTPWVAQIRNQWDYYPSRIVHWETSLLKLEPLNPSTVQSPSLFSCQNYA